MFWSNVVIEASESGTKKKAPVGNLAGVEDEDDDCEGIWGGAGQGLGMRLSDSMLRRSKAAELAVTYWHKEDERPAFDRIMAEVGRVRHLHIIGADREICEVVTSALSRVGGRRDVLKSLIYATVETDFKASMPLMDQNVLDNLPPALEFLAFCGQLGSPLGRNAIIPRSSSALNGTSINLEHVFLCLTPPIDIASLEAALSHLPNLQTLSLRLRTYGASPGAFITLPSSLLDSASSIHLPRVCMFDYDGPLYVYNHLSPRLRIREDAHRHLTLSVNGADVEDVKGLVREYKERSEVKFEKVILGMTRRAPEYLGMGSLELDLYNTPSTSRSHPSSNPSSDSEQRQSGVLPPATYPRPMYDPFRPPEYASLFLTLRFFFVSAERQAEIVTELFEAVGYGDVRSLGVKVTVPSRASILGPSYGGVEVDVGDGHSGESGEKGRKALGLPVLGALGALRRLEVMGCDGLASLVGWLKEREKEREEGHVVVDDLAELKVLALDGVRLDASSPESDSQRAQSARVGLNGQYEGLLSALSWRKERGMRLEKVVIRECEAGEGMVRRFEELATRGVRWDGWTVE